MDRTTRFQSLFPVDLFQSLSFLVVGCGAVGRSCSLTLAEMGATHLHLVDPDLISEENLGPQGWCPRDLGKRKVITLQQELSRINPLCEVTTSITPWSDDTPSPSGDFQVILSCADSMACRRSLHSFFLSHDPARLFIDPRMGPETLRLYCCTKSPLHTSAYLSHWFPDSEAAPLPCTAKATRYGATLSSTFALAAITRWLREVPVDFLTHVDLFSVDLFTESAQSCLNSPLSPTPSPSPLPTTPLSPSSNASSPSPATP